MSMPNIHDSSNINGEGLHIRSCLDLVLIVAELYYSTVIICME